MIFFVPKSRQAGTQRTRTLGTSPKYRFIGIKEGRNLKSFKRKVRKEKAKNAKKQEYFKIHTFSKCTFGMKHKTGDPRQEHLGMTTLGVNKMYFKFLRRGKTFSTILSKVPR